MFQHMRNHRRATGIFFLLLLPASLLAQEKQPPPLDPYGDPLPNGAIARLGTLRLVHMGNITAVAVSPDGKLIASGVRDGKAVKVKRKVTGGDGIAVYEEARVTQGTIRLWDAATGKLIREIVTPDALVSVLQFDAENHTLFAGCRNMVGAWEVKSGKRLWVQEVHAISHSWNSIVELIHVRKDRVITVHKGTSEGLLRGGKRAVHPRYPDNLRNIRCWDRKTAKLLPSRQDGSR